jgi:hypothetical protein
MEPHEIWKEQYEAAGGIEAEFGTQKTLDYLIDEKFINFLEAAETNKEFRGEIPAFVAEIKSIFEPWQLAQCLESASGRPLIQPTTKTTTSMILKILRWTANPTSGSMRPNY